jgi:oligo-1,6-glucosidase
VSLLVPGSSSSDHDLGTWDELTQEYYLHLYATQQPDLNWNNQECRNAIYQSAMRFWLDRGVDGFRVDTVNKYSKPAAFTDVPITDIHSYEQPAAHIFNNGPRIHEFIREMIETISNYDVMTVGELSLTPDPAQVLKYVSAGEKQLDMVFHIDLSNIDHGSTAAAKYDHRPFSTILPELKKAMTKWQKFHEGTDGWTTVFLENHDNGRAVDRYASSAPEWREMSAKMLSILMCTMTGTLFVYQGQEIGMVNAPSSWPIDEYQDIEAKNYYSEAQKQGPERLETVMKGLQVLGRDHARLPMQWDRSTHGGFTTAEKPWMRVHDLYPEINVERQEQNPGSVLTFWKRMIRLRKEKKDLCVYGIFDLLDEENENTFVFTKTSLQGRLLVALNFSRDPRDFEIVDVPGKWALLVGNYDDESAGLLRPFEGRVYAAVDL